MARLPEADVNQQPARAAPRPAIGPRGPVIWDRLVRYTREVWAEMKRVDWPSRPELVASTIVVVAVLGVLSAYLGAWDAFFTWLFTHVLAGRESPPRGTMTADPTRGQENKENF